MYLYLRPQKCTLHCPNVHEQSSLEILDVSQATRLSFSQSNDGAQISKSQGTIYQCPFWSTYQLLPKYSNLLPCMWIHVTVTTHRFYICKLDMSEMKDHIS